MSLDIGVQHALAEELKQACARYSASAAAGLVLDAGSGEVLGAVSLPEVDPARPADWLDPAHADKLTGGTFELGSIFKTLTIAMALEAGTADLDKTLRRAPAADRRALRDQGPLSAGPAAHGARDLPALLQRRRRHAGAGGGRRAAARVPGADGPHRGHAHGSRPRGDAAAAQALGADRDHHRRLRAWTGGGAGAVRRSRRHPRQRRAEGDAHAAGAVGRGRRAAAPGVGGHQRQAAGRSCAST